MKIDHDDAGARLIAERSAYRCDHRVLRHDREYASVRRAIYSPLPIIAFDDGRRPLPAAMRLDDNVPGIRSRLIYLHHAVRDPQTAGGSTYGRADRVPSTEDQLGSQLRQHECVHHREGDHRRHGSVEVVGEAAGAADVHASGKCVPPKQPEAGNEGTFPVLMHPQERGRQGLNLAVSERDADRHGRDIGKEVPDVNKEQVDRDSAGRLIRLACTGPVPAAVPERRVGSFCGGRTGYSQ